MEEIRNKDFYLNIKIEFEKVVIALLCLILLFQVIQMPYIFKIMGISSDVEKVVSNLSSIKGCEVKPVVIPQNNTTVVTPPPTQIKIDLSDAHKLGNGKVPVVVFSDYQCPYCERGYQVEKQIRSQYGNDVTIYFKNFPLASIHPFAQKAAEAAECAGEQGKFWEYHDYLFEHQSNLTINDLTSYADKLGITRPRFDICLTSGDMTTKVNNDEKEGIALGVQGTPTYYIGDAQIVGAQPFSAFEKEILARGG
jgi:protein-disulfide isomerase